MAWTEVNAMKPVLLSVLCISLVLVAAPLSSVAGSVNGQKILTASGEYAWEWNFLFRPYVIYNGSAFMMWYSGENRGGVDNIGLATSKDGISWTRYAQNPVLQIGSASDWDHGSVNEASVLYEDGMFKMYYTGQIFDIPTQTIIANAIGYATSPDGISWTKYPGNPIVAASPSGWDDKQVYDPVVVSTGSAYNMYYRGGSKAGVYTNGLATSTDGIHWTKQGLISLPSSGWDAYFRVVSGVVKVGNGFLAVYYGSVASGQPDKIGAATSSDGVNWTPYSNNPVVAPGVWDSGGIAFPMLLSVSDNYYVYYSTGINIGVAVLSSSQYPIPEFPASAVGVIVALSILASVFYVRRPNAILSGRRATRG